MAFARANSDYLSSTDAEAQNNFTNLDSKARAFAGMWPVLLLTTGCKLLHRTCSHNLDLKKQQYTHHLNRFLASGATVTVAKILTLKPPLILVAQDVVLNDTEPGSHRCPAIVSEWNFAEDVLLWSQTYRKSLSQTAPNFKFPLERMEPCANEVPDVQEWWCEMVASPLNCIFQNGIEVRIAPFQAALMPDFCFLDDGNVRLVGVIKCPWHQLASGPATTLDFMNGKSTTRQALAQLNGYMELNSCHYGVLTTYSYTWFVKRSGVKGELLISPPISYNRTSPTLLECYYYLACEMQHFRFHADRSAGSSAAGSGLSLWSATSEGSRPGTQTHTQLLCATSQNCSSEKSETSDRRRGDVF